MLETQYVNYDARPGEIFICKGERWRIHTTQATSIIAEQEVRLFQTEGTPPIECKFTYDELYGSKAYYVTRVIPCRPPEDAS